jgi:hypothetical protein
MAGWALYYLWKYSLERIVSEKWRLTQAAEQVSESLNTSSLKHLALADAAKKQGAVYW